MSQQTSPYLIYYNTNPNPAPTTLPNTIPFWDTVITDFNGITYAPGYTVNENLANINPWNITQIGEVGQLAGITISVDVHTRRGTNALTHPGKDKGAPVVNGIKPASFSIQQLIFDYANFDLLTQQLNILWNQYIGKAPPSPYVVYNPALLQIGITAGSIVSLSSLKEHASGGRVMTIEFLEWNKSTTKSTTKRADSTQHGQIVNQANSTKPSSTLSPGGFIDLMNFTNR